MDQIIKKTVNLSLIGLDGNSFSIMGAFQRQAKTEGWTKDEINKVINEAMSGDYNHLIATIQNHCKEE